MGALPGAHYVIRSFPLCRVRVFHPARLIQLDRQPWRPPKKQKNKTVASGSSGSRNDRPPVCVVVPTKCSLICIQIDNWNHFYLSIFSYRILRHSALAPNFAFDPIFRKGDMGSLVRSRECGDATAVSVTSFHPDIVAEIGKWGSRRLNLRFLVL